jgi:3',5'-nucleoside bisphosphate phosphatase
MGGRRRVRRGRQRRAEAVAGHACRARGSPATFDLQAHSTHSDGSLAPRDVVARAAAAGVRLMALTDHDTVAGVPQALEAAREHGIRCSPATELSAVHRPDADVHILGYELDPADATLAETLADFRADRERRVLAMAERLRERGIELDDRELQARRRAGAPLGRPHLADAIPGISRDEAFARYLVPGTPTYVPRTGPSTADAIAAIHAAGGVAVWAHPFWDTDDPGPLIERFAGEGIDGVECFYATHTEEQARALHAACRARNLLVTGSADFHGPGHECFDAFRAFSTFGLDPELGPIGRA